MGVSLGVDLSDLDVCFGGFSPTVMGDIMQAIDKAEEAEARIREHTETLRRVDALEAARASEVRTWRDEHGTAWSYVVLDGTEVRIEACAPAVPDLRIPDAIAGLPVVALAADACAHLPSITSVIVPDSVVAIGYCAFRNCTGLRRAVLSAHVASYDSGWFRNCAMLEDLTLPGSLDVLRANVFDNAGLRRLRIGAGTREVYPGAFAKGALEQIRVDAANPFLESDGIAVYTRGRAALVAMAVRVESYAVAPECTAVLRKALDSMGQLRQVSLPDGVQMIGEHAFAHTALREFTAPRELRAILERAFFDCTELSSVKLNDGLVSIGENAFTRTALTELRLPATVASLGHPMAADTPLRYAGPDATLRIDAGGVLQIDEQGALLRTCQDGLHLEWMVDPQAERLRVPEGVVRIDARALLNHRTLQQVEMSPTVREVGEAAFKGCRALRTVKLSDELRRIEDEAFLDTAIEALDLPDPLESIGSMALVTQGSHSGQAPTTLTAVRVSGGNARFREECGMLMERSGSGTCRIVHYMDRVPDVVIPDQVTAVAPYAFSGARGLRSLRVREGIADIGIRAFAVDCLIASIRIDMREPVEGHDSFEVRFPATDRGEHQQFVALTSADAFSVPNLLEHYDAAIANATNFDSVLNSRGISLYEQAVRILARLKDPVFMTSVNRQLLYQVMRKKLPAVCSAIAKRDDRASLDGLADVGLLTLQNMDEVLERVGSLQDAAMTGYLLELKRRRFRISALDFEI